MFIEKSETLQCLINAFAGESQARNRYTFYSKIAKDEGYEQISQIFLMISNNELEHAKLFYKRIPPNKTYKVNGQYPFFLGTTYENLKSAALGEKEEWDKIYKNSAQIAKSDGFDDVARLFNHILEIEKHHAYIFETLAENINSGTVFKKNEISQWICLKCGYTQISKEAPCKCPVCKHDQGYFQTYNEKF